MFLIFAVLILAVLSGGQLNAVVKSRMPSGLWQIGPWAVGVNRLTRRRCHVLVAPSRLCLAVV